MPNDTTPTLEERALTLRERELSIREREITAAERAAMSPGDVAFTTEMRQAKALAASPFLPETVGQYKDKDGNTLTNHEARSGAALGVMRFARLLDVDPYVLAQQVYVVHGRVGFSTSFLIGLVNNRGGLKRAIAWEIKGEGAKLSVTCSAVGADGVERAETVSMDDANRWGWPQKPGQAWKADPALMLRYRSAAKLIRLHFSDAVLGFSTVEEIQDSPRIDVTPRATEMRAGLAALGLPARQIVEQIPPVESAPTDAREPVPAGYGADFTPPAPGEPA